MKFHIKIEEPLKTAYIISKIKFIANDLLNQVYHFTKRLLEKKTTYG